MDSINQNSPYLKLATGKRYYFTELSRNSGVELIDLVPALFKINRFTGHTYKNDVQWDVGRHSLVVYETLRFAVPWDLDLGIHGLHHDLTEAVMGDVSTPLKGLLPDYREVYRIHENEIFKMLGIPEINEDQKKSLKIADTLVGDVEGELFMVDWEPLAVDPLNMVTRKVRQFIKERIQHWDKVSNPECIKEYINIHYTYKYGEFKQIA